MLTGCAGPCRPSTPPRLRSFTPSPLPQAEQQGLALLGTTDPLAAALRAGAAGADAGAADGKVQPLPEARDWDEEDLDVDDLTEDEESSGDGGAGGGKEADAAAAAARGAGGGGAAGRSDSAAYVPPAHLTPEGGPGAAARRAGRRGLFSVGGCAPARRAPRRAAGRQTAAFERAR
jgi:hypothetical protein